MYVSLSKLGGVLEAMHVRLKLFCLMGTLPTHLLHFVAVCAW